MQFNDITPNRHDNLISLNKVFKTEKFYGNHEALVDGDIIIYKAAFANKDNTDWYIVKENVDKYLHNIFSAIQVKSYTGFITSDVKCYRYDLELPKVYKANRTQEKPFWYQTIKEYLINHHNFHMVEGLEADDCISLLSQFKDKIIYSCDKDFMQLPGTMYNFVTGKLYEITKEQAYYNLWFQILIGDTADNLTGVPKIGEKKATDLFKTLDQKQYRSAVFNLYKKAYGEELGRTYAHNTYLAVRLLRRHNKLFELIKLPYELI